MLLEVRGCGETLRAPATEVMQIAVKKFGGTSVADVTRIKRVALLLQEHLKNYPSDRLVVVVSAMAGETNRLVKLANSCAATPDRRELDVLLASGEQVAVALLAMVLLEMGIPARSFLASQVHIRTDSRHTEARIENIEVSALEQSLAAGQIAVVAGFQGTDQRGDITTLGRGGSDVTAVALAAALRARACYIYTDVPGVYSTNPNICRQAKLLSHLCHEEMLELASLGAKVLHPRSVYFAMCYGVPLVVLSSFEPGSGTWIVKEEDLMEKTAVTGITYRTDEAKLTIHKLAGGIGALSQLFSSLAQHGIHIDMISQTGLHDGQTNISCTVADEHSDTALRVAQDMVTELSAEGASLDRNIAKISVVGIGMRYQSGVAADMFKALAQEKIEVDMISTSEIKISVVVPRKYCDMAVRILHQAFIEVDPQITIEK